MNIKQKIKRLSYIKRVLDFVEPDIKELSEENNVIFDEIKVSYKKNKEIYKTFFLNFKGVINDIKNNKKKYITLKRNYMPYYNDVIIINGFKNIQDFVNELSECLNDNLKEN